MRILLGGSPCTHWSIAQTKNRETKPEGLGWELFLNYLIALEKYQRKKVSPPLRADKPGGPKYHNQKDQREATDGRSIRFDSKKEARRFDELLVLLRAGKIVDLRLQPQFTIQEAYTTPEGVRVRAIRYQADFMYKREIKKDRLPVPQELDASGKMWEIVVEDVKSPATKTSVYEMKKKLLRERLGFEITEV